MVWKVYAQDTYYDAIDIPTMNAEIRRAGELELESILMRTNENKI